MKRKRGPSSLLPEYAQPPDPDLSRILWVRFKPRSLRHYRWCLSSRRRWPLSETGLGMGAPDQTVVGEFLQCHGTNGGSLFWRSIVRY